MLKQHCLWYQNTKYIEKNLIKMCKTTSNKTVSIINKKILKTLIYGVIYVSGLECAIQCINFPKVDL